MSSSPVRISEDEDSLIFYTYFSVHVCLSVFFRAGLDSEPPLFDDAIMNTTFFDSFFSGWA